MTEQESREMKKRLKQWAARQERRHLPCPSCDVSGGRPHTSKCKAKALYQSLDDLLGEAKYAVNKYVRDGMKTYEALLELYSFLEPIVANNRTFSRYVQNRLEDKEMKTKELAERVDVSYQTVHCWLNGKAFPKKDPRILQKLVEEIRGVAYVEIGDKGR